MHTRQVDESRRRQGAVQGGRMYVEEERELEGLSRVGPPTEETQRERIAARDWTLLDRLQNGVRVLERD